MARGRFISNTLGGSKKFSRLKNDTHRLAYVLLVTHADVEGRVEAYPPLLKGYAYTLLPWTNDDVQAALEDMHKVGLIHLYLVDNEQYAEVIDFTAHNKVRKDRESSSKIPSPRENSGTTPGGLREYSGSTPPQVEVEVQVKDQVQGEGEVEVQDAPPPTFSEDNFDNLLNGSPPANETHRVRAAIRRLNADFAKWNEESMTSWAHWSNDQIRKLWEASEPSKWPDGNKKRRSWIFADLLNQERIPPQETPAPRNIADELLKQHGLENIGGEKQ